MSAGSAPCTPNAPGGEPLQGENQGKLAGRDHFKKQGVAEGGSGRVKRRALLSAEKGEFRGDLAANVWAGYHNLPGEAQDLLSGYIPRGLFSSSWEMKGGQS